MFVFLIMSAILKAESIYREGYLGNSFTNRSFSPKPETEFSSLATIRLSRDTTPVSDKDQTNAPRYKNSSNKFRVDCITIKPNFH